MLSSSVAWNSNNTSFTGNNASSGGVIHMGGGSSASWDGESTIFSENSAYYLDGGAVYARGNSTVSWKGYAKFSGNTASRYGGALNVVTGSEALWSGNNEFLNNSAGADGGVISAVFAKISWEGNTIFAGNSAGVDGGAIDSAFSTISWTENTTFANNSAVLGGGAISAGLTATSWSGEAVFFNNTAGDGGAIHIIGTKFESIAEEESTLRWEGSSSFVRNTAISDSASSSGGAVFVALSTVSWAGEAIFSNNTASFYGGALFIDESNVTWSGDNTFSYNKIDFHGGGISVGHSSVSWDGTISFVGNDAVQDGGGIFIGESSQVSWSGGATFSDNTAGSDGGALALEDKSSLVWVDGPIFLENSCKGSGGAIALLGDVYLFPGKVVFKGNAAETAGGAVFISGTGTGPIFVNSTFTSNTSPRGGAVYSASSGTTRDNNDIVLNVTYDGCSFTDNHASTSGGAIESVAGEDNFVDTIFEGNSAGVGGALRLGGSVGVTTCAFIDNISDEASGSAVSNLGILEISESTFSGNGFSCESGKYFALMDGNRYEKICKGCQECGGCEIEDEGLAPICAEQLAHTRSTGGNSTIESVSVDSGYWRATSKSLDILECYNEVACEGGVTGEDTFCQVGYEGPYCSICSDGYSTTLSFTCEKCINTESGAFLMAIVAIVAVALTAVLFNYLVVGDMVDVQEQGSVYKMLKRLPLQSIKIIIVVWQILTQFTSVANVTYPEVYQRFLDSVNVLNFDALWIPSVGCIIDADFHDRLLVSTILPIAALLLLAVTFTLANGRNKGSDEALVKVRDRHTSMALLISFLVYSSVSATIFQAFACEELDDDKEYLRVDYRIECDSSKHKAFQILAGVMILVYPVGIPLLYALILYKNRTELKSEVERESSSTVQPVSDLWRPYKPERFYYEVVECLRRILLTGVVVFIYPNTAAQVAVTLAIAFVFVIVSERLSPYISKWDSTVSLTGHVIVFMSMYVALLSKVDVSDERSGSQDVFAAILVAAHVCMIIIVIVETVVIVLSLRKDDEPVGIDGPIQGVSARLTKIPAVRRSHGNDTAP